MKKVELNWKNNDGFFVREAFNTLRTNVLFCGKNTKAIVITSCLENEGKSTVALGLARGLAENGEHVLFLDADLRKSVMAGLVKSEGTIVGLSQVLSGQVSDEDAIYATDCKGLDVIFAGPFPPNPAELLTGNDFRTLLTSLKERYDHVIIDAAPLGLVVDASAIAAVCDGSILLINRGQIKARMAQNVKKQLERSGCPILGVVMNQTARRGRKSEYGYYYDRYGYRNSYRYGKGRYGYHGKYAYYSKYAAYQSDDAQKKTAKAQKKADDAPKKVDKRAEKVAAKAALKEAKLAEKRAKIERKEAKKAEKRTERQDRKERLED